MTGDAPTTMDGWSGTGVGTRWGLGPTGTGATLAAVGLLLMSATTGCGAADGGDDGAPPTIASPDLGGRWRVAEVTIDGEPQPDPVTALIELETDFGGVEIDTDCGTEIGAFTLDDDGRAGFSLTGGSTTGCSADTQVGRDQLVELLGEVDQWSGGDDRLALTTPSDHTVELTR
jgi:hypothetical protein